VRASTANAAGSSARSSAAAPNPSTRLESPPAELLARQCSSCRVGTGSRYGLSVCGAMAALVNARLLGRRGGTDNRLLLTVAADSIHPPARD
jgi:hypothetical protein